MWQLPRRTEILEAAQASFGAHGHWVGLALTLNDLTQMAIWRGDYPLAHRRLNESISLVRRSAAFAVLSVWVMFLSGRLALREGDYARARVEIEESAQRFLQDGRQTMSHTWAVSDLGYVALRQSDWQRACHHWTQSLHNFRESNTPSGVAYNVEGLAFLAVQRGQLSRAARLFAWADATREAINDTRPRLPLP